MLIAGAHSIARCLTPAALLLFATFCDDASAEKASSRTNAALPCAIEVVDRENGWPVPLVELRTTHNVSFFTDNAGRVAFDLPELMGQETALTIESDGYAARADGLGFRGVRVTPKAGATIRIEVDRTSIAKRLGRLTGAGLFAESQKLGLERNWTESGITGCDSVQNAVHRGKLFWAWGDTSVARYPLGIYHMTGATSSLRPFKRFEPPIRLKLSYFTDENDRPRGVAEMPGDGPTWVSGLASLPDASGKRRLVGTYAKIKAPLEAYETGLCAWNDETSNFEHVRTLWTKSPSNPTQPPAPRGHCVITRDDRGRTVALFGDPLPTLRCAGTFEAWQDPKQWEHLKPQDTIPSADDGSEIKHHSGAIAWNAFRKRWVAVFMQHFGKPSAFGEIWYAESKSPYGPWGPGLKVLSHENYTFYNVQLHPEFTPADSPILLFEGTYTKEFANNPEPTPRYDYNQILYRLDLDDPKILPAQGEN